MKPSPFKCMVRTSESEGRGAIHALRLISPDWIIWMQGCLFQMHG